MMRLDERLDCNEKFRFGFPYPYDTPMTFLLDYIFLFLGKIGTISTGLGVI